VGARPCRPSTGPSSSKPRLTGAARARP
jgi:hypothetical protein